MQFSDDTESGWPLAFTGDHGLYTCAAEGNPVTSTLQGKYILVTDSCGPIS